MDLAYKAELNRKERSTELRREASKEAAAKRKLDRENKVREALLVEFQLQRQGSRPLDVRGQEPVGTSGDTTASIAMTQNRGGPDV
jgi:hypothetical protein